MLFIAYIARFMDFRFTPFHFEAIIIGILIATAIYFFTKNKWGSILLSVPASAIYLFYTARYTFNVILVVCELLIQYYIVYRIIRKNGNL